MSSEYQPHMSFVVTSGSGGPYDSRAYFAGYEAGALDGQLNGVEQPTPDNPGMPRPTDWRWVYTANLPQLDLIAMQYGYAVETGDTWDEGLKTAFRLVRREADNGDATPPADPQHEHGKRR